MNKSELNKIGRKLDAAERAVNAMMDDDCGCYDLSPDGVPFADYARLMHERHEARSAYGQAVAERSRAACDKFAARKTPFTANDGFRLRDQRLVAELAIDRLDALGPEFSSLREFIDANAAFTVADFKHDHAQAIYHNAVNTARRRDAADRASNIVRHIPRNKSTERHL